MKPHIDLRKIRGDHLRRGATDGKVKICNQCRQQRPLTSKYFDRHPDGRWMQDCKRCKKKYRGWSKLTTAQKLARMPRRSDPKPQGFVLFKRVSTNRKLGGIPMSISERGTCPPSCSFYNAACFADYGWPGVVWRNVGQRRVSAGRRGIPWDAFLEQVRALPEGQLWRHNVAGDLPGEGQEIDVEALDRLVRANNGRRGFTYTHKRFRTKRQIHAAIRARVLGFTINQSADSLEEADKLAEYDGYLPIVVVVPHDAPLRLKTPAGRRITICPAETEAKLTCAECELCALPNRKTIVGFRAHGQFYKLVDQLVRSKRSAA